MPSRLKKNEYGLLAAEDVRWLLQNEPEVMNRVRSFILDQTHDNTIDVSGPTTEFELMEALKKGLPVPLPTVKLRMRMVKDNLTGDPGVEVLCSDKELEEVHRWRMMALLQKVRPGHLHRA